MSGPLPGVKDVLPPGKDVAHASSHRTSKAQHEAHFAAVLDAATAQKPSTAHDHVAEPAAASSVPHRTPGTVQGPSPDLVAAAASRLPTSARPGQGRALDTAQATPPAPAAAASRLPTSTHPVGNEKPSSALSAEVAASPFGARQPKPVPVVRTASAPGEEGQAHDTERSAAPAVARSTKDVFGSSSGRVPERPGSGSSSRDVAPSRSVSVPAETQQTAKVVRPRRGSTVSPPAVTQTAATHRPIATTSGAVKGPPAVSTSTSQVAVSPSQSYTSPVPQEVASAAPPSPTFPHAEEPLPGVAGQLVRVLAPLRPTVDGTSTITVSLHPEALGKVEATVTAGHDSVSVTLTASTSAGADALRQSLSELHDMLQKEGQHTSVSLSNATSDGSQDRGGRPASQSGVGEGTTGKAPEHSRQYRVAPVLRLRPAQLLRPSRPDSSHLIDVRV